MGDHIKTLLISLAYGHLCEITNEINVYLAKPYKNKEFSNFAILKFTLK